MKCKVLITMLLMFLFSNYMTFAQELRVEPGTNIKIEATTTLGITGDLILESDATGDATVIALGSVTGNAIVQRYLPGSAAAWHMISSPVSGMAINDDWYPEEDEDFFLWDEPSPGTWVNIKNTTVGTVLFTAVNPGNDFFTGRGYLADYNTADPTYNFEGTLTTGNVIVTLDKSETKDWDWSSGWNLIGNPYASGLDWNSADKDGLFENYAQVYNSNKTGGDGYECVETIGSGQAFFVLAASDGAVLNFTSSQQVHTTAATFLKKDLEDDEMLVMRLTSGPFYDETIIKINPESLPEHDFWDATKLSSFDPKVPQISTLISGTHPLTINSIPSVSSSLCIPISIKVPADGNMTINLSEIKGAIFEGQRIILHDLQTNTMQTLNDNPNYSFNASVNDSPNRFLLKFEAVGLPEYQGQEELKAYMNMHQLYTLNPYTEKAQLDIFSIQGQLLLHEQVDPGLQSTMVNVHSGIYVVVISTSTDMAKCKIFIKQ